MKKYILLLFCSGIISTAISQSKLPAAGWQADLRYLQQVLHKDYPFLFKKVTPQHFDSAVDKLYSQIPSLQDHEVLSGFTRLIASFKYGHTDIWWDANPIKFTVAPINFCWFSDGVFVEGADKQYQAIVGAKLVKIEGLPIKDVLVAIEPLVPVENDQYFKAYGLEYIGIPEALHAQGITKSLKTAIRYSFEKDGKLIEQTIPTVAAFRFPKKYGFVQPAAGWSSARDSTQVPLYLKNLDKIYYFEYLPQSKTVYARQSQIQDDKEEPMPRFYKRLFEFIEQNDIDKLVLDLRLNSGGNNTKNKPIITGVIGSKKINRPGKFFVIIGKRTFSACQNLINELSNYTEVVFVGEPSAENINFYGDNREVILPATKLSVRLSFAWWQDKPQWDNNAWTAPQLAADMTFEDYRANRDPALDACLKFSDKDLAIEPMIHLQNLFMAGKRDQVESETKRMVADPRYRYIDFEGKINESGYNLLNIKQFAPAIGLFQLNTKLFPTAAKAWAGLGEAQTKLNQSASAMESYKKAIQLDPNGAVGIAARNALRLLETQQPK